MYLELFFLFIRWWVMYRCVPATSSFYRLKFLLANGQQLASTSTFHQTAGTPRTGPLLLNCVSNPPVSLFYGYKFYLVYQSHKYSQSSTGPLARGRPIRNQEPGGFGHGTDVSLTPVESGSPKSLFFLHFYAYMFFPHCLSLERVNKAMVSSHKCYSSPKYWFFASRKHSRHRGEVFVYYA